MVRMIDRKTIRWSLLTKCLFDVSIDSELAGGQGSLAKTVVLVSEVVLPATSCDMTYHHEQTRPDTGITAS